MKQSCVAILVVYGETMILVTCIGEGRGASPDPLLIYAQLIIVANSKTMEPATFSACACILNVVQSTLKQKSGCL